MQNLLAPNTADDLTNRVWERWKKDGINPRGKTWLEIKKLVEHFLKLCREQGRDYQELDFYCMIDSNLNYYENFAEIENQLGQVSDKEYYNKLMDEAQPEITVLEDKEKLEAKTLKLEEKLRSVKDDLSIEIAKRQATETELAELKKKQETQLKENFLEVPPIAKPAYLPENIQYTNAELIEIIDYIVHRKIEKQSKPRIENFRTTKIAYAKIIKALKWAIL